MSTTLTSTWAAIFAAAALEGECAGKVGVVTEGEFPKGSSKPFPKGLLEPLPEELPKGLVKLPEGNWKFGKDPDEERTVPRST